MPRRWHQVGGSDSAGDSGKRARSLGRARRKPLKPLRAGMPGDSRCTRGDYLVRFLHFAREAAGATGTRHSPRPHLGGRLTHNSGGSRRENMDVCLHVIASEAKQSRHHHSGAMRSIELRCAIAHRRISRFRVWCCAPPRNDDGGSGIHCCQRLTTSR